MQSEFHTLRHPWAHAVKSDEASSERRVVAAALLTAGAMCFELIAGWLTGSMALLAAALHCASSCTGLGITVCAYRFARHGPSDGPHSSNSGAGKASALAAFAGSVLLLGLAAGLGIQSMLLLMTPAAINYEQAVTVAIIALLINALTLCVLAGISETSSAPASRGRNDRNLRNAFMKVLSVGLMSLVAVAVLTIARSPSLAWLDPLTGLIGGIVIARGAWQFLQGAAGILLDHQAPKDITDEIIKRVEEDGTAEIADLEVWPVGPALHSASVTLLAEHPHSAQYYKQLVTKDLPIVYSTVEVFQLSGRKRRNLRLIRSPIESLSFGSPTPALMTPTGA